MIPLETLRRDTRAAVGYAVTWIMSQRLLIHRFGRGAYSFRARYLTLMLTTRALFILSAPPPQQHHAKKDTPESESGNLDVVVFPRPAHIARKAMSTLRSKFDFKGAATADPESTFPRYARGDGVELGIHVHVERAMAVNDSSGSEHSSSLREPTTDMGYGQ